MLCSRTQRKWNAFTMESPAVTAGYRIIWKPMVFLRQHGKGCKRTMKEWEGKIRGLSLCRRTLFI